jgi:hypothetical protein
MSDIQDSHEQMAKLEKEVAAKNAAQAQIEAIEAEKAELRREAERAVLENKLSKDEFVAAMKEERDKNAKEMGDMRNLLFKLKAQGKAHIEEKEENPDSNLVNLYGKNSKIGQALSKK